MNRLSQTLLVLVLLLLTACGGAEQQAPPAASGGSAVAGDSDRGKTLVAQYGCLTCHVVPGVEGPRGRLGPSLAGMGSRPMINGQLPNTPENMARYLQNPQAMVRLSTMPALGMTAEEAGHMAAFLSTLQ